MTPEDMELSGTLPRGAQGSDVTFDGKKDGGVTYHMTPFYCWRKNVKGYLLL